MPSLCARRSRAAGCPMDTASRGSPAAVSGRGRRALWDRAVPVPVHHRRCAVSSQCGAGGVRRRWVAAVRQHPGALVRTGHLHVGRETAVVRVPAHRSVHRGPHRCQRRQKALRCMPEWEWPEAACLDCRRGLRHPHVVAHGQLRLDRARVGQLVVHAARMACVERRVFPPVRRRAGQGQKKDTKTARGCITCVQN